MNRLLLWFVAASAPVLATSTEPPLTALAFAPGGDQLVAVSQSGLHVFTWPQLELTRTIEVAPTNLHAVAFSSDGAHVAIGGGYPSEEGVVSVLSWPAGLQVARFNDHEDSVRSISWLSDSKLVSASIDRTIKVWDIKSHEVVATLSGHSRSVNAACLLTDDKTVVTAGDDQSVRVWDLESKQLLQSLNQHTGIVHSLALRPEVDGLPMVASGAADRTIRFWQPSIGRMVRYMRLASAPLGLAWLHADGKVAAACSDGHVRVIDADQLKVLYDVPAIDGWAYAIKIHPIDGTIAVAGSSGKIRRVEYRQ